ncbi:MAG: hypothetical protein EOP83_32655, partial [Verrucomicrobiaceae bacterium]
MSKTLEDILPPLTDGHTGGPYPSIKVRTSYGYKPTPVTVEMKNESAEKVLNEVARQAGMYARVSMSMVTIWPTKENWEKAKAEKERAAAASEGNDAGAAGGAPSSPPAGTSPEQARADAFSAKMRAESIEGGKKVSAETKEMLKTTIIPHVSFKEASIDDVAASLGKTINELLPKPKDDSPDTFNSFAIHVRKSSVNKPNPVTLEMKDAYAGSVLNEVAKQAGMQVQMTLRGVTYWPKQTEEKKTEEKKADAAVEGVASAGGSASVGAAGGTGGGTASSEGQDVSGSFLVAMKGVLDPFFTWICAATLRASVIGGVIIALQLLLGRIIPARWRYALWAPMVLVLVMPVLPEVPFGLFPAKPAVVSSEVVATPAVATEVPVVPATAPVAAVVG